MTERPGNTIQLPEPSSHNEKPRQRFFPAVKTEVEYEDNEDEESETRLVRHQYVLRRPRALQYSYKTQVISAGDEAGAIGVPNSAAAHGNEEGEGAQRITHYAPEGLAKHRERLDLFIDLIWVGIIGNLSEVFSAIFFKNAHSTGDAVGLFILLFLPSWRIWNFLREFLNNYYMDDGFQRIFIFWILVLSVFFGNNLAYFAEDMEAIKNNLIIIYLVIRGSFLLMELVYCIYIPWLRRLLFFSFFATAPVTGLWMAAMYTHGVNSAGAAVAAVAYEYIIPLLLDSPWTARLTPTEYRKEVDADHLRTRMASFFVITVGEGVLVLIKDGPLGIGIHRASTLAIWPLLVYFMLAYLYFNRDQSVQYIHAVRRKGWRTLAWISCHIPLFASFITMSSSVLFILNQAVAVPEKPTEEAIPEEELRGFVYRAIWNMATSLAIIVLSMTCQALLDTPLDPPGTLLVDNRYVRLAGRFVYIIVILTVPIDKEITVTLFFAISGAGLSLLMSWEWVVSLEQPAKFLEPRGLTTLIRAMSQ